MSVDAMIWVIVGVVIGILVSRFSAKRSFAVGYKTGLDMARFKIKMAIGDCYERRRILERIEDTIKTAEKASR